MPTIDISKRDLEGLVGAKFSTVQLEDLLLCVKGELENVEGDALKVDIKDTNRPDLWSVDGIARELRGFLGKEKGVPRYSVKSSGITATVDAKLAGIRQCAAYAVVKNVRVNDEFIKQMIQLQEKVCQTFGRKRDEAAIGIFDFGKVHGNVHYIASDWKREFVPLGYRVKMSLGDILKEHPKGIEYGKLLAGKKYSPLLVDDKGEVLSMPPIINSEGSGKVTTETRNLFIDVTGHDQETINVALRIFCAAFAGRGARIESVKIKYGKRAITTPDLGTGRISFDFGLVDKYAGLGLNEKDVISILGRRRVDCTIKGKKLTAEYPNYRADVLHAVDIIEDVIIGCGYNSIKPLPVTVGTVGSELAERGFEDALREVCIGLGLQEVLTFSLTSAASQQEKMGIKGERMVEIANPASANYTVLRSRMLPEVLAFLAKNKHRAYPQRVFEIGKCVEAGGGNDTGVSERLHLCIALNCETNFTEIKSMLDAIAKNMGFGYTVGKAKYAFMKEGRGAEITVNGRKGFVGELSENVRSNFELQKQVSVLEIEF